MRGKLSYSTVADNDKSECCGCSACADVCPVEAISMERDNEGFAYPKVDQQTCIRCGKCVQTCGFKKDYDRHGFYDTPRVLGVRHSNPEILAASRSGAAFVGISDFVLSQNGVVYGAEMNRDYTVSHCRAESSSERNMMKKAKYVQSDTTGIFKKIEIDLRAGRKVLFTGTPCQVSGLRGFLKNKSIPADNLLCCDMICHGVPSPEIWSQYLQYIANRYGGKILEANFRDKEFGWEAHFETFQVEGRKKKVVSRDYTDLFYEHIMLRPSCSQCPFANVNRVGDITFADFWGIEKQGHDEFNDDKGVSLVLINNIEGQKVIDRVLQEYEWFETSIDKCLQPTLIAPSIASARREQFWNDYQKMPFRELIAKYTKPESANDRLRKMVKEFLYTFGVRKHP